MLPLDLHVLSLSLAFILSQDQTLHTKKIFINIIVPTLSYVQIISFIDLSGLALAVRLFFQTYCNILKNYFFPVFSTPGFSTESGCKDKAFYQFNPNFFELFF